MEPHWGPPDRDRSVRKGFQVEVTWELSVEGCVGITHVVVKKKPAGGGVREAVKGAPPEGDMWAEEAFQVAKA